MVSKRLSIYGFISAAAIVSGALAGCAGSSSSVQGASPVVTTTGGITNTQGTSPAGATTTQPGQQVQVTINGTPTTGVLPVGEVVPQNGIVATIPSGTPIIQGLQLAKFNGRKGAPETGAQGEVDVDGVNTGLTVTATGELSGILILVPGQHTIHAEGPFAIVSGIQQLTVGQFNFGLVVLADGNASIPSSLEIRLPANGGSLANGNFVTVGYPTPDFAAGTGTLSIQYSGITVNKVRPLANGAATYKQITSQADSNIPSTGVDNVTFNFRQ